METEEIFCANCHHVNQGGDKFCEVCGEPIGVPGPPLMEKFFTDGIDYKTMQRPAKLVIVFGVWVIFLPAALAQAYYSLTLLFRDFFIIAAMMAAISALLIVVVIKTTNNYIKNKYTEQKKYRLISIGCICMLVSLTVSSFFYENIGRYPIIIEYENTLGVTLLTTKDQIKQSATLSFYPPNDKEIKIKIPNFLTEDRRIRLKHAYKNGTKDIYIKIKIIPGWLSVFSNQKR